MERQPTGETIRSLPIYRGGERLDKRGEVACIWPGIIQLLLQCNVLIAAQLNRLLYDI